MFNTDWLVLVPAYGRDYKTAAEVKAAWEAGKDFMLANTGQYISKNTPFVGTLEIRYAKLVKLTTIKIKEKKTK